jgi:LmbE family N-acetylglucosaminyl deacetylase
MRKVAAVIAAHPDDEVLGCGATIVQLVRAGYTVHVLLMSDGETSREKFPDSIDPRKLQLRKLSASWASEIMGCESILQLTFPDNRMDSVALLDVIKPIEEFIAEYEPSLILTHHSGDVNIDHRTVHEAVITACRPQPGFSVCELLFFEIPSSTEWRPPNSAVSFSPNWFVDVTETLDVKFLALEIYESELRSFPHPRSIKAIEAQAIWRGASVGVGAAEAFVLGRKLLRKGLL